MGFRKLRVGEHGRTVTSNDRSRGPDGACIPASILGNVAFCLGCVGMKGDGIGSSRHVTLCLLRALS